MSIEAMTWALGVPIGGNEKLVLLGLANHAHPDGRETYPALDTLARYAHCNRSTARRNVRKLVDAGWAIEDGTGPKGQTKYRLPLGGLQNAIPAGCKTPPGGGSGDAEGVAPMPPEPSIEPSSGDEADASSPIRQPSEIELDRAVFEHWREACGHPTAKPTDDRLSKIRARRREGYTQDQMLRAIDGAAVGAFVNEVGKRFDDLTLIFRTGSKLEDFIDRAERATAPAATDGRVAGQSESLRKMNAYQAFYPPESEEAA